ncbi:MAG: DUF484 family protein [Rubrimonas sp.]|uniref:DUF484 family protein n=1 Tax=Rubrimonas sp. TaxID=2036015 RepID=UPI002FDE198F
MSVEPASGEAAEGARDSSSAAAALRALILAEPGLILDDREVMRALIEADGGPGRNVVDLRGALVKRLETRLERLERTHRDVIAAAYETLSGAGQVQRVTLTLLEQDSRAGFLRALLEEAPTILGLDAARLCLEPATEDGPPPAEDAPGLVALPHGGIAAYLALGVAPGRGGVWLRPAPPEAELIYGEEAGAAASEALIALDDAEQPRALLAFASADPRRFSPEHGADLAQFLGAVAARLLRRWSA